MWRSHARALTGPALALVADSLFRGAVAYGASDAAALDGETYVLSVGRMEIAHDVDTDDSWSPAPDLVVCIARTDPEVRGRIQRLGVTKARLEARQRELKPARDRLRGQEEESARERVEPLTEAQTDRLGALVAEVGPLCSGSRGVCRECPGRWDFDTCYACTRCPELDLLQWRKNESERVAVAPLTERQRRQLDDYEEEIRTLGEAIGAAEKEMTELRGLILGSSQEIETDRRSVDFGDRDAIRVHAGDEIDVSVWDNDLFNDDLYGRAALTLDGATLKRGTLDVSMPNIKSLRLHVRMRPADWQLPRANATCR